MIQTIKNKLVELLLTVPEIKDVYTYPEMSPKNGYPYIYITWEKNESDVLTNRNDNVYVSFKIVLVQEKSEVLKGSANAEITSDDRVDKIEKLFRDNNDLGLTGVLRIFPAESTKTYDTDAKRIIVETLLKIHTVENITY
jgi:hypothetical protein